jgi:hypothetical protein
LIHHADVAQLVERDLAKVEVAGSSPVVRSKSFLESFYAARAKLKLAYSARRTNALDSLYFGLFSYSLTLNLPSRAPGIPGAVMKYFAVALQRCRREELEIVVEQVSDRFV